MYVYLPPHIIFVFIVRIRELYVVQSNEALTTFTNNRTEFEIQIFSNFKEDFTIQNLFTSTYNFASIFNLINFLFTDIISEINYFR